MSNHWFASLVFAPHPDDEENLDKCGSYEESKTDDALNAVSGNESINATWPFIPVYIMWFESCKIVFIVPG